MATSLVQLLQNYKVVIPIIQRDYAQGRRYGNVPEIRDRFVNKLLDAFKPETEVLELDFIYGFLNKKEKDQQLPIFTPLDGQQRLTTLFLLHWFVSYKEGKLDETKDLLLNFSYETRHSSRVFCEKIVTEKIIISTASSNTKTTNSIGEHIENQYWFFSGWKNDPTISSMLTMLNTIEEKLNTEHTASMYVNLWSSDSKLVFHQLDMSKLNLPDELYIKMNSRGKPLTNFEYFKSQFSEIIPTERRQEFNEKIDKDWYDLFWRQLSKLQNKEGYNIKDIAN